MRALILWLALLLAGPAAANDWQALEQPGAFAIMRHALAPGTGEPPGFELGDCSTQRNLDTGGRAQTAAIGEAFRERGHIFDVVLTSQWCRCRETAALLALGPVQEAPAFNSFFRDAGRRAEQTQAAIDLLRDRGDLLLVVTHQVNISALTGRGTRSGEVLVVRHAGDRLAVLGSILIAP